jgi:threonine aldolase
MHHEPDSPPLDFASDNHAGAHPEIMAAIWAANHGHQGNYGTDDYTRRLQTVVKSQFGDVAEAFPVFNGTASNVVALQSMQPTWGAVVCSDCAHLNTAESVAPERVGGMKLLALPAQDGKIRPEQIADHAHAAGVVHHAQPSVVSITQATELGTVYLPEEITAITDAAHSLGMATHMDGARLSNAAASLDLPLRALTTDAGIDVLSFGGTKNGLLFGEAVVVLNQAAVQGLDYIRKLDMQLASKMRFLSCQLIALLEDDLWKRLSKHANAMAAVLRERIEKVDGVTLTRPTESNAVFAILPGPARRFLHERAEFQDWDPATGEVRWMCAFDTTVEQVESFAALVSEAVEAC